MLPGLPKCGYHHDAFDQYRKQRKHNSADQPRAEVGDLLHKLLKW